MNIPAHSHFHVRLLCKAEWLSKLWQPFSQHLATWAQVKTVQWSSAEKQLFCPNVNKTWHNLTIVTLLLWVVVVVVGYKEKWWEAKICLCSMLKGQSGSLCTQSLPWTWTHAPGANQICQSKYRELVSQCARRWYKCQQGPTPKPDLLQRRNSSNLVVKIVLGSNCQHKCWMWWWCDKRLTWTWTHRLKVMACISLKLRKPYKSWLCVIPWYILPFSDLFGGEISYFWKNASKT